MNVEAEFNYRKPLKENDHNKINQFSRSKNNANSGTYNEQRKNNYKNAPALKTRF